MMPLGHVLGGEMIKSTPDKVSLWKVGVKDKTPDGEEIFQM